MTDFKLGTHAMTGMAQVNVFDDDGHFVASIYGSENGSNQIHIVSKHFDEKPLLETHGSIPLPGYAIKFQFRR